MPDFGHHTNLVVTREPLFSWIREHAQYERGWVQIAWSDIDCRADHPADLVPEKAVSRYQDVYHRDWFIDLHVSRKYSTDPDNIKNLNDIFSDQNFWAGIIIIPLFWLFLYVLMGTYRKIFRKSRLKELGQTLLITVIGVSIIFFTLILDDIIVSYRSYYILFIVLFSLHFTFTYLFRLLITSITVYKIHNKIIGFNTIIIGKILN